jgi:hypothetical protein
MIYDYTGTYKVPNLVPIDKWMIHNTTRVMAYHTIMDMFPIHSKRTFLDEKHIINGNILPTLNGYVDIISVSGNFHSGMLTTFLLLSQAVP